MTDEVPAIRCEKCGGQMRKTKVDRYSLGIQVIGYAMWVPAACVVGLLIAGWILSLQGVGSLGGCVIVGVGLFCLPAFTIGLTLCGQKLAWKCERCGHYFPIKA
jgi:predicted branched-subunit amino acid permease